MFQPAAGRHRLKPEDVAVTVHDSLGEWVCLSPVGAGFRKHLQTAQSFLAELHAFRPYDNGLVLLQSQAMHHFQPN